MHGDTLAVLGLAICTGVLAGAAFADGRRGTLAGDGRVPVLGWRLLALLAAGVVLLGAGLVVRHHG